MVQGQRERMEVGVAPVEWPRESGGGVGWGGEEAGDRQGRDRGVVGRVRCYRDNKGMRVWPQKVTVTCRVTFWVERWGWKPSWQELRSEWEVSRGRRCESGGEMKETEDTGGTQRKAAVQAGGGLRSS